MHQRLNIIASSVNEPQFISIFCNHLGILYFTFLALMSHFRWNSKKPSCALGLALKSQINTVRLQTESTQNNFMMLLITALLLQFINLTLIIANIIVIFDVTKQKHALFSLNYFICSYLYRRHRCKYVL